MAGYTNLNAVFANGQGSELVSVGMKMFLEYNPFFPFFHLEIMTLYVIFLDSANHLLYFQRANPIEVNGTSPTDQDRSGSKGHASTVCYFLRGTK